MPTKKTAKEIFVKNGMDIPFFVIMLVVLAVGLVMLLSASSIYSFHYTENGDSLYYFKKQAGVAIVFVLVIAVFSRFNYRLLKPLSLVCWIGSMVLLFITVLKGGGEINRWMYIGPIGFQPSEFAKLFLIIYCATGLDKDHKKLLSDAPSKAGWAVKLSELTNGAIKVKASTTSFFYYAFIIALTAGMVLIGSHLSGAILILLIGVTMLWIGEGKARWFVIGGIVAAVVLVYVIYNYEDLPLKDYMIERIRAWLIKDYEPDDARWQINHSLYALGSGGLLGAGIGNSKQKYLYVSECHTDFIFSIIGEELGFIGCVLILALFALLICRGIYIGMRAKDRFGALLAFGMTAQLALQVVFNIAVITDTVPNTGIPLPFFSYGGTALMITLAEMGIILSVSRQADLKRVYSLKKKKTETK